MSNLLRKFSNLGKSNKSSSSNTTTTTPSSKSTSTPANAAATPAATTSNTTPAASQNTSAAAAPATQPAAAPATATTAPTTSSTNMSGAKIAVVYHSLWGHISQLAEQEVAGLKESGAQVEVFTFPETLSDEALGKMYANKELGTKYPTITPDKLKEFDGFLFGFGTRYGRTPAQVSSFFDHTGGLWAAGALVGKFAGFFTSTSSQHGGQETTALTTIPFLVHHGVNFVPIGYQFSELTDNTKVIGGSAYGAATLSNGDGSRQPVAEELAIAKKQGAYFGKVVGTWVKGSRA